MMENGYQYTPYAEKRYDKMADFYDNMGRLMDKIAFKNLRGKALARSADDLLEIGVGMGKSLPYYKKTQKITAIDFSQTMLQRAEKRKKALGLSNMTLLIRRTQANIERAGFVIRSVESRFFGVVRLIVAEKQ